jgi:uncharacterized integral membrane protein (TIGR00697 family)
MKKFFKNIFAINKLDFLISLYIFCIVVSELMGGKTFPLLNTNFLKLNASVAILVLPFVFSINDIIVEVYGLERGRSVVRSGLLMVAFLFMFAALAVYLPPSSRFVNTEAAYDTVFGQSIRISLASLIAFTISDFTDVFIFAKIKKMMGKKALWFRNNVSNFISELIDTVVFMTLAFYVFNQPFSANFGFLISLITPYWLLKCFMSVIETPFVYIGVNWLKKK